MEFCWCDVQDVQISMTGTNVRMEYARDEMVGTTVIVTKRD